MVTLLASYTNVKSPCGCQSVVVANVVLSVVDK